MNRLAVISNPKSHRNLHGPAFLCPAQALPFLAGTAAPVTQTELLTALTRFKQQGADILVINGGDGTLRDVLSALWRIDPDWRPALSLVPGGKTNLTAYDVGCVPHGAEGLRRIFDAASHNRLRRHIVTRPVMDIARPDVADQHVCGMFLGAGAFSGATELARNEANAMGLYHGLAVAWTIASVVARNMRSNADGAVPIALSADSVEIFDKDQFILIATTANRIVMGLKPFWGPGGGAIRFTAIDGPPKSLARALLPVLRGRPRRWMLSSGYNSGRADTLTLRLASRFTVDGELFDPGPSGRIEISARRTFDFVYP